MNKVTYDGANTVITTDMNVAQTLDCGQAFRWSEQDGVWSGIALGRELRLTQTGDKVTLLGVDVDEYERIWRGYFDMDRDYGAVKAAVSGDPIIAQAIEFAGGIHILRQEPWEAVCSFIISANNNIPRIKGIIGRLCESFGEPLANGGFTFPDAKTLAPLCVEDLAPLRSGFRAKYILDAARKFASGEIDAAVLYDAPIDEARKTLMTVNGVGPKVADCALLFGWGRIECFPVDVWIRRAMAQLFGDSGLPQAAVPYAGIVQQYIFHWARMTKLQLGE